MPHSPLDVALWLPTADTKTPQDALHALAGAATETGKTLDAIPADTAAVEAAQLSYAEHRACVIATIKQYRATLDANFRKKGAII